MKVTDFYFLYQTTGFPRFYADLCVRHYGGFNAVATCREGVFRYYVHNEDKKPKSIAEIEKLYGSTADFTATTERLYKQLAEFPEKVKLLTSEKPTVEALSEFFEFVGESFLLYALFDHVNSDNLFIPNTVDNAKELARVVAENKNKLRERFDEEFFNDDSRLGLVFNWLTKAYDTSLEKITAYTTEELLLLVETNAQPSVDSENFVLAGRGTVELNINGKEAVDFISEFESSDVTEDTSVLTGTTAYGSGVVKGVVRVIDINYRNLKESLKVINNQKGDFIFVAESTLPEMVPAMERSLAVITDVGGILSHAAITARELKKPCLIGTQHGTEVLRDGDEVEVNLDKGTVRIL